MLISPEMDDDSRKCTFDLSMTEALMDNNIIQFKSLLSEENHNIFKRKYDSNKRARKVFNEMIGYFLNGDNIYTLPLK